MPYLSSLGSWSGRGGKRSAALGILCVTIDPLFPFWGHFRLPALLRFLAFGSQHAITKYCPRLLAQMCARCLVILIAIFSEFLLVYRVYFSTLLVT